MPTSQIMILYELLSIICGSGGCWTNPGGHHAWHHEHHEGSSKPLPAHALNLDTRSKTGSLLLVTGRRMLTSLWKAHCLRIGSTSWLQGSDEVNNSIKAYSFNIPQYSDIHWRRTCMTSTQMPWLSTRLKKNGAGGIYSIFYGLNK